MMGDSQTQAAVALLMGYLLGSIPFGLILTRLAGKGDIRKVGSGNIGATNVLRAGGKWLAAATLILDAAKAAGAVLLARALWPDTETFAAAGALVGHIYPAWLKFRGGKGVATYLGLLIPLVWQAAVVYAVLWIISVALSRISSVGAIIAAFSVPISAAIFGQSSLVPILLGFTLLVLWRHHGNISRLIDGTEPAVGERRG